MDELITLLGDFKGTLERKILSMESKLFGPVDDREKFENALYAAKETDNFISGRLEKLAYYKSK